MGSFDPTSHDHLIFEEWEFDVFKFNYPQIKQLLDRQCFQVDIKNGRGIRVQCPVVFISNNRPNDDRAFLRRVHVIEALESLEYGAKIRVPKEEVDSTEMEVIDISSSSDDENQAVTVSAVKEVYEKALSQALSPKKVLSPRNVQHV